MTEIDWYGPEAATFGDRLAAAREQAGMTQGVLAKRIGIRLSTLRNWENDVSEPRANRLSTLAGLLNVSMMWLINGEGEGIDPPAETEVPDAGIAEALTEIRRMRAVMLSQAEALGRLEKQLRKSVELPTEA